MFSILGTVFSGFFLTVSGLVVWDGQSVNLSCGSACNIHKDLTWRDGGNTVFLKRNIGHKAKILDDRIWENVTVTGKGELQIPSVTYPQFNGTYHCQCGPYNSMVNLVVYRKYTTDTNTRGMNTPYSTQLQYYTYPDFGCLNTARSCLH